ncbi:FMN-binding protein [Salisediminibacterium beveridgei]|uniref:Fumarate reductase flavoprotein subunit n=1 Tax=Salisediminibacterium beveridgei TaxID=632773 RepID=A0A1D7QZF2_9BACI|nr:FMN-binding protein [Salisediminibacterium beveridgei]AOM84391.1 Fumarate reductase flavoprotein subunit [Salisediminibacterium beveridgei]
MKKWMLLIGSSAVILGGCGSYDASSEPLPYEDNAGGAENEPDEENNDNNSDEASEEMDLDLTDGVYETTGEGYNDDIVVETTIENGEITNVEILSHDESDGISDDAINDLPDLIVENNSANVDGVSGATYSSGGIISAVEAALEEASGEAVSQDEDMELTDGVFETSAEGYNDDIVVETTIEDGEIVSVEILSHDESDGISDEAIEDLPGVIVENNSTDVDGMSGATFSSEAILKAVQKALEESAGGSEEAAGDMEDGVYETTAEGYNDDIVVETTIEGGVITNVEILSHDESDGISDDAINDLPDAIVDNNSADIDGASGATYSSEGILIAVQEAMDQATK